MASFELSGNMMKISGILDGEAEVPLRAQLQKLMDGGAASVSVDMTAVTAITSICIGVLVAFWIDMNEKKRKVKLNASAHVKRVLDMTGLTSVLMKQQ